MRRMRGRITTINLRNAQERKRVLRKLPGVCFMRIIDGGMREEREGEREERGERGKKRERERVHTYSARAAPHSYTAAAAASRTISTVTDTD